MNMQRKVSVLAVFLLCLALLAGCAVNPSKEPNSVEESSVTDADSYKKPNSTGEPSTAGPVTEDTSDGKEPDSAGEPSDEDPVASTSKQSFSDKAGASIGVVREEIGQATALFGMTYVGYFSSETAEENDVDFGQWFQATSDSLAEYYPFVSEIDENHTVGTEGHLYCIVAKDDGASVEVAAIDDGEVLYRAENGDPILLFCNRSGDARTADIAVTVTAANGTVCRWEPTLDETGHPQLLIGDEREVLSWDFTPVSDTEFDVEGWLAEGWGGPTAVGLAYDAHGMNWQISTWDDSESYRLSFYLNESDGYDGEVVLQCFYEGKSAVQAEWRGLWRIETEMEQPSRLYLDLTLTSGADADAFENSATVSESYLALIPLSGNNLLLVADNGNTVLPLFPDGVQAVELAYVDR